MGFSIGSISKDNRFFLDQLLIRFPQYFKSTVVDVNAKMSEVTHVWQTYNKDLLKWRWKQIKAAGTKQGIKYSYMDIHGMSKDMIDTYIISDSDLFLMILTY